MATRSRLCPKKTLGGLEEGTWNPVGQKENRKRPALVVGIKPNQKSQMKFNQSLLAIIIASALALSAEAQSTIVYNVNLVMGDGGVVGTVTTDGVVGLVGAADILDWNFTVTGSDGSTFVLVPGPSGVEVGNNTSVFDPTIGNADLTADTTNIYFNFDGTDGGYFGFQTLPFYGGQQYWSCGAQNNEDSAQGLAAVPILYDDPSSIYVPESGTQIIATAAPATLVLTFASVPPARATNGQEIVLQATISNSSATDTISNAQVETPLTVFGTGGVQYESGPNPAGTVTLPPGGSSTFSFTFLATNYGTVIFSGSVSGILASSGQSVTATGSNNLLQIAPNGDLLIQGPDSASPFFGGGIYQTFPAPPQIISNNIASNANSSYEVHVVNNETTAQNFTLLATVQGSSGWSNSFSEFVVGSSDFDVTGQILTGLALPSLAPGASLSILAFVTDVTPTPGSTESVTFTLGLAGSPELTLDAVQANWTFALPAVVGHVYCSCDLSPIPGASVMIGTNNLTTDPKGYYALSNLDYGTYPVTVTGTNFPTVTSSLTVSNEAFVQTNDYYLTKSTPFTINAQYDGSITNLDNAQDITNAIGAAIQSLTNYISTPVCVTIVFSAMGTGLGQSTSAFGSIPYTQYVQDLRNQGNLSANDVAALASLNPGSSTGVSNNTIVVLTSANLDAIGEHDLASDAITAAAGKYKIGLNLSLMNITRPGANPALYDLQSAVTHEMDEVLGSGGAGSTLYLAGSYAGDPSPTTGVGPLDLYRYSGPGTRSYTLDSNAISYFSINGGTNKLVNFNQYGNQSDFGDWGDGVAPADAKGNTPSQVQDAFGTPGSTEDLGANELIALDVVGYTIIGNVSFSSPTYAAGTFTSTFGTIPGQTYQIQRSQSLQQGSWNNVGTPFVATGVSSSFSDPAAIQNQKFYRTMTVAGAQGMIATPKDGQKVDRVQTPVFIAINKHVLLPASNR